MVVLGIETSCDETSAAVFTDDGILSNIVASQEVHTRYGGVVPELASRAHIRLIVPIVNRALERADMTMSRIEGIAVTYGPGLVGSILVGLNFAKGIAYSRDIPWTGVNHIEGHIFANYVNESEIRTPFISLIISGGHTQLVHVKKLGEYEVLGKTRDDAAGEAYDKVAKMMDLGYPGGPLIDKMAEEGDEKFIAFPRPMLKEDNYDFSFSGVKTAVLYYLKKNKPELLRKHQKDIVASFQAALVEVLVDKTIRAARDLKINNIALAGGVASNSYLRKMFIRRCDAEEFTLFIPPPSLCTDNAAMIACTGHFYLKRGERSTFDMSPKPSLNLS
ncbi:MAG: tRNA (adenosine(37)-N6)-threonylcarbamoyltransferase complex transferase subunit TsaD [candidate division KSB1 bacterium]|jgi:N6-L-threonylcarbamoyladenine synthase|nr:tRNA (adenosine(37)-N6)-threonylcarbamoyltransferase complex transferase subunit TsaD [candidate division KSB1 bacterium]